MAKGKQFNKKRDQHFQLVFREQSDAKIHDDNAPQMVLKATEATSSSKSSRAKSSAASSRLDDLASQFGDRIRDNEGEAAEYGVYYDDTEYDYMQHLRDLNAGGGDSVWVSAESAASNNNKGKGKQKQGSLEDALRRLDLDNQDADNRALFGDEMLPSQNLQSYNYQSQQDIPDAIGGFQPDMDPRIREALEALEDEAYVDNAEDDDLFKQLTRDGNELDEYEFEEADEDDDGWESDDTAKPASEFRAPASRAATAEEDEAPDLVPVIDTTESEAGEAADTVDPNWMDNFSKFKQDLKSSKKPLDGPPTASDLQSSLMTTTTNGGRTKKRKGALTSTSSYSMTSSSLFRNEFQRSLDAQFDNLEQKYDADQDDMASVSQISGVSGMSMSSVTGSIRTDFDNVLDDFLGGYTMQGKKHMRKGGWKSGAEQLDEIRRELGPARIPKKYGGGAKLSAK